MLNLYMLRLAIQRFFTTLAENLLGGRRENLCLALKEGLYS